MTAGVKVNDSCGLDVHKEFIYAVDLNGKGKKVLERSFLYNVEELDKFLVSVDRGTEFVVEACGMYEPIYDWLDDRGFKVKLAHPKKVRAIAEARIKTDAIDAGVLANLNRMDWLPEAYVPPKHVREIRNIVRHRAALVRQRSRIKHCVNGILLKEGLKHDFSDVFGKSGIAWLKKVELKYSNRLALDNYLAILSSMNEKIELSSVAIEGLVNNNPEALLLTSMPGIGKYSSLLIVTEIGDVKRFSSAEKLCSYAGIVPSLSQSGTMLRRGHITKEGNKLLRWILIQCAHKAVASDPHLKKVYTKLKQKKGSNIAIVAVARKMLSYMYIMLTQNLKYTELKVYSSSKTRE